jgi:hypothetical protein
MEPFVLVAGLTALSMATTALFDLLTGPLPWRRKVAWAILVVGVPLIGPLLYHLHAPPRQRRRTARRPAPPSPAREHREEQPEAPSPDRPEAPGGHAAGAHSVDPDHA